MKKIGLVSYHRDPNYGTMLQAFALAHTIKKLGYDCEYLNYYEYKQPTVIKKILSKIYHTIKRLLKIKGSIEYDFFNNIEFKNIKESFYIFHECFIPYSKKQFFCNTISTAVNDYDFFIVGSDQTWSEAVNKFGTTINFLDFVKDSNRKRSYALSIGTVHINKNYLDVLLPKLKQFRNLSCRERQNCNLLESELLDKVEFVLDPTFLLSPSDWNSYIHEPIIEGKYILAYILGTRECISKFAEKLGEHNNLPVYYILTRPEYLSKDNLLKTIGPFDFVNLIENASFIVTDSFHGTILSINFEKNFYSFTKRDGSATTIDNDRIGTVLQEFELNDRLLNDEFANELGSIDYIRVKSKLENLRESSLNYLKTIIE